MQRFLKKTAFLSLFSLGAALSACHDDTPASTTPTNPRQAAPQATASQVEEGIRSLSCALECCLKKKADVTNTQYPIFKPSKP